MERVCVNCGVKITNLAKQVGQIHRDVVNARAWMRCMDCCRPVIQGPCDVAPIKDWGFD